MDERKSVLEKFGGTRRVMLLVVGFVAATWFYHWQNTGSGEAMREVASEYGLELSQEGQRWNLRGRIDDMGVEVKTTTENRGGDTRWFTDFKVYAPDQPHGQIVGASFRQKAIGGVTGANWLNTGDANFDKAVLVEGDPVAMLAHLDAEARAAVQAATGAGWTLESVTWSARKSGRVTSAQKIRSLLDLGLAAARAIRLHDDVTASLRERAKNDPLPGVRAAATAILEGAEKGLPEKTEE